MAVIVKLRERIGCVVQRVGLALFAIGERIGGELVPAKSPMPASLLDDIDRGARARWFNRTTIGEA
jgi:hypothetical protein